MKKERIIASITFWFSLSPFMQKVFIEEYEDLYGDSYDLETWVHFLETESATFKTDFSKPFQQNGDQ